MNWLVTVKGGAHDGKSFVVENVTRAGASETIYEHLGLNLHDPASYESLTVEALQTKKKEIEE